MASNPVAVDGEAAAAGRPIEDLMLSELIESWLRRPGRTWRALRIAVASEARQAPRAVAPSIITPSPHVRDAPGSSWVSAILSAASGLRAANTIQLLLYGVAIVSALAGSILLRGSDAVPRAGDYSLMVGAPFLWLGFLLWLAGEAVGEWAGIRESLAGHGSSRSPALVRARPACHDLPGRALEVDRCHDRAGGRRDVFWRCQR